jgi:ribosomal protein L40E
MEEGKKKIIMVAIIVVCLVAAVIITLATRYNDRGSIAGLSNETMVWLKCRDPNCENTWQMGLKDYHQYVQDHRDGMAVPAFVCPKCNGKTGYRAEKCEKCGYVFEKVPSTNDVSDRCPKCGYSALEAMTKESSGK